MKIKSVSRKCQQSTKLKPGMMVLEVNGKVPERIDQAVSQMREVRAAQKQLTLTVIDDTVSLALDRTSRVVLHSR
eukprot:SAG31_NODE_19963_length_587_cov_1.145492_2_plen_75_part_00